MLEDEWAKPVTVIKTPGKDRGYVTEVVVVNLLPFFDVVLEAGTERPKKL